MFLHVSVILSTGGITWAGTPPGTRYTPLGPGTPPGTRYTPQTRYTPSEPGTPPWTRYPLEDQVHPPGPGTPLPQNQVHPLDQVHPLGPGTPRNKNLFFAIFFAFFLHFFAFVLLFFAFSLLFSFFSKFLINYFIICSSPPWSSACWEIRATSGRYASYWNAFLFNKGNC